MPEVLNTTISIQLWLIAVLGLLGAIVGVFVTLASITFLGKKELRKEPEDYREKARKSMQEALEQAQSIIRPAATNKFNATLDNISKKREQIVKEYQEEEYEDGEDGPPQAPPVTTRRVATRRGINGTTAPPVPVAVPKKEPAKETDGISVTAEGLVELERRSSQRINYRVPETAELLGVDSSKISKLVAGGHLKSFITQDGIRWIQPDSIVDLLNRIGIDKTEENTEEAAGSPGNINVANISGIDNSSYNSHVGPNGKLMFQQHYWYFVDNNDKGFVSLRDALRSIGVRVTDDQHIDWRKIPADVRDRIHREKTANSTLPPGPAKKKKEDNPNTEATT
jgi:gas vesicle protein